MTTHKRMFICKCSELVGDLGDVGCGNCDRTGQLVQLTEAVGYPQTVIGENGEVFVADHTSLGRPHEFHPVFEGCVRCGALPGEPVFCTEPEGLDRWA